MKFYKSFRYCPVCLSSDITQMAWIYVNADKADKVAEVYPEDFKCQDCFEVFEFGGMLFGEQAQKQWEKSQKQKKSKQQSKPKQQIRLKGMNVVLTGKVDGMTRKKIKEKLESIGAIVQSSVTKSTNLVIKAKDFGQSKITKAKSLGIKIVDFKDIAHRF